MRCIEFDTTYGEKTDNNKICVDSASGALMTFRNGNELAENSEFFAFAGQVVPAKIRYSVNGVGMVRAPGRMQSFPRSGSPFQKFLDKLQGLAPSGAITLGVAQACG